MMKNKELIIINIIRETGLYFLIAFFFLIIFIWSSRGLVANYGDGRHYAWNWAWLIMIFCLWISIYTFTKTLLLIKNKIKLGNYSRQLIYWNIKNKGFLIFFIFLLIGFWIWVFTFMFRLNNFLDPSHIISFFVIFTLLLSFCLLVFVWYQYKIDGIKTFFPSEKNEKLKSTKTTGLTKAPLKSQSWITKWIYLNGFYLFSIFFVVFFLGLNIKMIFYRNARYGLGFWETTTLVICLTLLSVLFVEIIYSTGQLYLSKTQDRTINLERKIVNGKIYLWSLLITLWLVILMLLIFIFFGRHYWLNPDILWNLNILNFSFFGGFAFFWTFCLIFLFLREQKVEKETKLSLS